MMTEIKSDNIVDESISSSLTTTTSSSSSASAAASFHLNLSNSELPLRLAPLDILAKTVVEEIKNEQPTPIISDSNFVSQESLALQSGVTFQEGLEFCAAMGSMIEDMSKKTTELISTTSSDSQLKQDELLLSLQEIILAEHNYNKPYSLMNQKVGKSRRRSTTSNKPNNDNNNKTTSTSMMIAPTKKPRKIKEKHKAEKAEKKPKPAKIAKKELIDKPVINNNNNNNSITTNNTTTNANATNKVIKIKKRTKNQTFELLKSQQEAAEVKSLASEPIKQEAAKIVVNNDNDNDNNNNSLTLNRSISSDVDHNNEKDRLRQEIMSLNNNNVAAPMLPQPPPRITSLDETEVKAEPQLLLENNGNDVPFDGKPEDNNNNNDDAIILNLNDTVKKEEKEEVVKEEEKTPVAIKSGQLSENLNTKSDIIKIENDLLNCSSSFLPTKSEESQNKILNHQAVLKQKSTTTTPQSGRSQRVRKKPKRWDDDEVEVDFSGQLHILGSDNDNNNRLLDNPPKPPPAAEEEEPEKFALMEETTTNASSSSSVKRGTRQSTTKLNESISAIEQENVGDGSSSSDDDDNNDDDAGQNEDDSSFSSDDDPEKLWCICRQPYDDRFMISCDSCEEWFHGKCVNVTKVQGRKMERFKQEWFCKTCIEGMKNGITREELKREAEIKAAKIEAEERAQFVTKKAEKKMKVKAAKKVESTKKKKTTTTATVVLKKESPSLPLPPPPPPSPVVVAVKSVRRISVDKEQEQMKSPPPLPLPTVTSPPVVVRKEEVVESSSDDEEDDDSIKSEDDADQDEEEEEEQPQVTVAVETPPKAQNKSSERASRQTAAKQETQRKESLKELEDKRKLKKLIKASKKGFIEKQEKLQKIKQEQRNSSIDTMSSSSGNVDQSELQCQIQDINSGINNNNNNSTSPNIISPDEFSKVVTIKKSDNIPKKKHKLQPIDRSVQDLFKAEPVLVRSLSTSSTMAPVSVSPIFQRKSSGELRRTSTSSTSSSHINGNDIYCPAGCGKINKGTKDHEELQSIYCNQSCIQTHVTEMIKFLRSAKRLKEKANPTMPSKPLKGVLINRLTGKIMSGKDALLEKDLLDFVIKNPTYEIYKPTSFSKPNSISISSSSNSNSNNNNNNNHHNHHHHSNSSSNNQCTTPTTPTKSSFNSNNNNNHHNKSSSSSDSKKSSSSSNRNEKSSSITSDSSSSKKLHEKSSATSNSESSKKSHERTSSTSSGSPVKVERTSSISEKPDDHNRRKFVRNAMKDIFNARYKEMSPSDKSRISVDEIPKLSLKIEEELFKLFKCINPKYNVKSRSLIFNLKDPKNSLYRKVLMGKIPPGRLVNMSAEELASSELARWRENEKKTMIELIKRDAVDQANQIIVKKTHKGEEIIQESHDNPDLPVADSQIETISSSSTTSTKDYIASSNETNILTNSQETLVTNESIANALILSSEFSESGGIVDLLDTTSQHKSHVFSNNCKICTRNLAEDVGKHHEKESSSTTSSSASSSSPLSSNSISKLTKDDSKDSLLSGKQHSHHRSQPKRVRIELESTNKFLEKVVKMSDKLLKSNNGGQLPTLLPPPTTPPILAPSSSGDSSSNCSETSPVTPTDSVVDVNKQQRSQHLTESGPTSSSSSVKGIWKGTIFMQDVAKFVANAYNLSGNIAQDLAQDMSDYITVCGRITPEQVLDYVAKLKISKRTDIGVVKFVWSTRDERVGYDAFFNYLNVRGRYGVVGNVGKNYKDFYILPLSRTSDIPKVLLPVDSSAIESKIHRPNLLLGILIRSKKSPPPPPPPLVQPTNIPLIAQSSNSTPTQSYVEQSYTPPPPEDLEDDDGSYTPPQMPPSSSSSSSSKRYSEDAIAFIHDSNSKIPKYDPEEPMILRKSVSPTYINDLMEKVATSSNPVDMTQSVLSAIANSDNLNLQKRLLEQLTEKVEDQRRQLEKQKRETEEKIISHSSINNTSSSTSSLCNVSVTSAAAAAAITTSHHQHLSPTPLTSPSLSSITAAALSTNSVSLDNVFNNIKNIQIPDNLKDILQNVQEKTAQIEAQQARLRSINTDFISNSTSVNDPRLRAKKSLPVQPTASAAVVATEQPSSSEPVASHMSQDELLRKAQEQMAALAQMEHHHSDDSKNNKGPVYVVGVPTSSSSHGGHHHHQQSSVNNNSVGGNFRGPNHGLNSPQMMMSSSPNSHQSGSSGSSMPKISFSWKKKK